MKRIYDDEFSFLNFQTKTPLLTIMRLFFWQLRKPNGFVTIANNTTIQTTTSKIDQQLELAEKGIIHTVASSSKIDVIVLDLSIQASHGEKQEHGSGPVSPTIKKLSTPHIWSNWAGNQQASPTAVFYPSTLDEIQSIVQQARQYHKKIRCVASAFSMSSISKTDDYLVNTKCLSSIYKPVFDKKRNSWTVPIQSGVSIKALDDYLRNHDPPLAMSGNVFLELVLYGGIIATGAVSYNYGSEQTF